MTITSILILTAIAVLVPYALYIDYCRRGRNTKGQYIAKKKAIKPVIYYSALRGGKII